MIVTAASSVSVWRRPLRRRGHPPLGSLDCTAPHVPRWYLTGSTIGSEIEDLRQSVVGDQGTQALVVVEDDRPIGWCQWYRCDDDPDHAVGVGAMPDDIGIDHAIGDPDAHRRGA